MKEINLSASFPELNPNPLVETDLSGAICYLNPAAKKLFLGLESKGIKHAYLAGINLLVNKLKRRKDNQLAREIKIGNSWFLQTLRYLPATKHLRIYGFDITGRKRAEQALKESEERLNKTQEIAHLGTWGHDFVSNLTYWSNETYRMYGYKPREVKPSHITFNNIVHPDDRKRVTATYFDSLRAGENGYTHMFRIMKKSTGALRYIYEKCEHIKDSAGKIVNSIGMVQDITERKRAEEALRESEEKFRAVAETAKDAIVSANSRSEITYFNKGAEKIFGYTAEEVLGKPLSILMPERFREDHRRGFSRFLQSGESHTIGKAIELAGKRKNGSEFPIELSLSNWQIDQDIFFTAIIRDITERKRIEIDLEKFKLAVENAEEHIIITDPKGYILYANDSVTRITGYSKKEILGKRPSLWGKQMSSEFYDNLWRTIRAEKKTFTGEIVNKRKNGQLYHADVMISHVFDNDNNIKFFIGIERDISERKRMEQNKDDFISIASHELKAPVATIKIVNQMLHETLWKNPSAKKYLERSDEQLARMTNLINDLLDVARMQVGKLEYREEKFLLQDFIEKIVEEIQTITPTHKITIIGKTNKKIRADKHRISQALTNLLSNAIKYSPKSDRIKVGVEEDSKKVVISITDYGVGIAKKDRGKIFERFYRAHQGASEKYPGLGIGLYFSRQIARKYNGDIWFKSTKGKGSTFYFSLSL